MTKKLISIIMALVMVLTIIPVTVLAADSGSSPTINPATGREAGPARNL